MNVPQLHVTYTLPILLNIVQVFLNLLIKVPAAVCCDIA